MPREDDEREAHMKKLVMIACAAAVALHATCALAGAPAVKLPPYTERTLPNGLRVFIMETREVPLVTAALIVPAGSAADGPGAEGIANLTSRLLMKGAGGMTADDLLNFARIYMLAAGYYHVVFPVNEHRSDTIQSGIQRFNAGRCPRGGRLRRALLYW